MLQNISLGSMEDQNLLKFYIHNNMQDKKDDDMESENMKLECFYAFIFQLA